MIEVIAYKCEGCGQVFAQPLYHDEAACLQRTAEQEQKRVELFARLERVKAQARKVGVASQDFLVFAMQKYGVERLREFACSIYDEEVENGSFPSSHMTEACITALIQGAIPTYEA